MYILPPSISKKIEGYRWQSFTPPAAGKSRRFRGLICHRRSQSRLEEKAATNALIRTTTALTMIAGGVKPNVVPQEARAVINFRILAGDSVDSVTEHVQAVINNPNIEVRSFDKVPSAPSPVSDVGSTSFAALRPGRPTGVR